VCDLKISDVTLGERSGSVLVRYGKGSKQRGIPLNSDARKAILTWLKVRGNEGEYLFIGPDKERMKRQVVTWHIGQLGKKVGLELNPHRLRHTFGKNLVDSGVSLDRVAMLLGHSNLTTTAVYTLPGEGDLQRAVDKISWED
jgi:site-specific recombinase XerD